MKDYNAFSFNIIFSGHVSIMGVRSQESQWNNIVKICNLVKHYNQEYLILEMIQDGHAVGILASEYLQLKPHLMLDKAKKIL